LASIINSTDTGSGGLITTGDSSDELQLQTAETTAITITSGQQSAFIAGTAAAPAVTTTGDLNTGIYFPAADNIGFTTGGTIRGRWTTDGLCFGSDTAAANALDDYEEGTWTPVLTFATPGTVSVGYHAREAFYTKIGRFVHFSCFIQLNAFTKGTASGGLRVSGLPFTAQNPGNNELPINWAVYDTPLPTSAGQFPTPLIVDNNTIIDLIYASNNTVNVTWPDPDSSSQYKLSGCYQV
jgi:hypothetical protein